MTCPYCGGRKVYIGARCMGLFGPALSLCLDDECLEMSVGAVGYLCGIPFWPLEGT